MIGKLKIRAAIVTAALALGLVGIAAPAALASGPSSGGNTAVTATATVGTYISLTGLTATVPFGALTAGQYSTVTGAETESVSTNDGGGYVLSLMPGSSALSNGTGGTIPNANLSVTENPVSGAYGVTLSGSSTVTLDTETASGNYQYNEDWHLMAPNPLPNGGTYSESFAYLALAN